MGDAEHCFLSVDIFNDFQSCNARKGSFLGGKTDWIVSDLFTGYAAVIPTSISPVQPVAFPFTSPKTMVMPHS